jgi:hypothetical protein
MCSAGLGEEARRMMLGAILLDDSFLNKRVEPVGGTDSNCPIPEDQCIINWRPGSPLVEVLGTIPTTEENQLRNAEFDISSSQWTGCRKIETTYFMKQ